MDFPVCQPVAMSQDSYTVAEAAKVLGRSTKRVRQMLAEGKLVALPDTQPVRLAAEQVNDLRQALRTQGPRTGPTPQPTGLTYEQVQALVDTLTTKALEAAASDRAAADRARDATEEALRNELAEARARAVTLEAQMQAIQASKDAERSRKWWRKA
jgi:hypothetical protein